jgi:glycosyltransferase involved in cell wall biosynthesis
VRVAQVAPLYESVPPKRYGGTERVVSYITEELVRRGHDVTLFASGGSVTRAKLISACERSLRTDERSVDPLAPHVTMLNQVFRTASNYDIIHFHIDYLHFPASIRANIPNVTTLHGRLDISELELLYREFSGMRVVSISDAQREPLPWLNWQATVHHGLPQDLYSFTRQPGGYLAFVGRISPEKGVDQAIEIAVLAGMRLKIAAKVDAVDQDYFEQKIRPLLTSAPVDFIGEIGESEKNDLLGNAVALLMPVDWPEPFGLVMIEAMACGTPTVAFRRGAVAEIIQDGVNGFVCNGVEEAASALARIGTINRKRCRQVFEDRFTATRMVKDYLDVYERVIEDADRRSEGAAGARARLVRLNAPSWPASVGGPTTRQR